MSEVKDNSFLNRFGCLFIIIIIGFLMFSGIMGQQKSVQNPPSAFYYTSQEISRYCTSCNRDIGGAVVRINSETYSILYDCDHFSPDTFRWSSKKRKWYRSN